MRPGVIEVHIEELVLEGVSAADRLGVGAALERHLGHLFAERGVPEGLAASREHEALDGGSFVREPSPTPSALGAQVARAVYGGLGR